MTLGSHFIGRLISLPRYTKRAILMSLDFSLLCFALWCSYSLRLGMLYMPDSWQLLAVQLAAPALGIFCFHNYGLYKLITRFAGRRGALKICLSVAVSILGWLLLLYMTKFTLANVPRSVIVMYGLFSIIYIWTSRSFITYLLSDYIPNSYKKDLDQALPVLIYGVGEEGTQLYHDLDRSSDYRLVGFIDDNPSLWRQMLFGLRVNEPTSILDLVRDHGVKEIFLADPTLTRRFKRDLLNKLAPFSVKVKALPALHEIASGKVMISDLRSIGLEDLLGRVPVPAQQDLLEKTVRQKVVMITGAGGSIGSEIARQVISLEPTMLILYERSEFALYQIEYELRQNLGELAASTSTSSSSPASDIEIVRVLGSVLDDKLLRKTISTYGVNTLYHAAAYKHVPIVEDNPFAGIENNVFGTELTALAARDCGVDLFVLISTDKAVRPTNVMGASKRVAELVLQALADEPNNKTLFTMVRFGNVLGSSGSVVSRFREQIQKGGPVTVTHPEIIRYFMTIPEAAQLVIQAGGLAKGGDVFVLDMGQPVKIVDLAKSMINLSGLEVVDEANPDGDIAIEFMGLREGEKLYEELLINENCSPTDHVSITRNNENYLTTAELAPKINSLRHSIDTYDAESLLSLLSEIVEGYQISDTVNDLQNQNSQNAGLKKQGLDEMKNSPKPECNDQDQFVDETTVNLSEQPQAPFQGDVSPKLSS
jgi:FlaA1/EpsC-like NDP-sugar epimerase